MKYQMFNPVACFCRRISRDFCTKIRAESTAYGGKFHGKKKSYGNKQELNRGASIPLPDINGEILFGIHSVSAALSARRRQPFTAFFKHGVDNGRIQEIKNLCMDRRVQTLDVTGDVLDEMSGNHSHQGVCLDASPLVYEYLSLHKDINSDTLYNERHLPAVWMLPYKIRDTMNMGNVLRSAHFFGVSRVLLPTHYSASLNSVVSKASAGALEVMDIKTLKKNTSELTAALAMWKENGGRVVGSTCNPRSDRVVPVNSYVADKPTLLIVGNEAEGLDQGVTDLCDDLLFIQRCHGDQDYTQDALDSLNVTVATGILLHAITSSQQTLQKCHTGRTTDVT